VKKLLIVLFVLFILSFSFVGYNQFTKKTDKVIDENYEVSLQMAPIQI